MDKTPTWLRILQISIGAISIILSGYVLVYPGLATFTAIQILAVVLLIVGVERIAVGIFSPYHKKSSSRFSNIGLGSLVIAFSVLVIAFPLFSMLLLILLGGLALLFDGIARIIQGLRSQNISKQSRALLIGVGILSIAVSGLILAHPVGFGVPLLAVLMTIALLIVGIVMIAMGTTGERIVGRAPMLR